MNAARPRILFVCIENSNRSQMAEAFARALGGDRVDVYSAGSRPSGQVNPRAIRFMKELGIDMGNQRSKGLDEVPQGGYDAVITMGCGDACPFIPAKIHEDWGLTDPKTLDDDGFRAVRDEIRARVADLLQRLGIDVSES